MEEEIMNVSVESMVALVEYITKNLVDEPNEVKLSTKEDEEAITIELSVAKDDMGKVIGKQGRIAKAIRTVVRAASVKRSSDHGLFSHRFVSASAWCQRRGKDFTPH